MGRKKKKQLKPWCWYCNREFDDEKILIQHQKSKHFKCSFCHKKLYTGPGLSIHSMQVHKEKIDKIPFALPHRSNVDLEIYGMEGIPDEDLRDHEKQKIDEPEEKKPKIDVTISTQSYTPGNMPVNSQVPYMTTMHLPIMPPTVPMNLSSPLLMPRHPLQVHGMMPRLNSISNPVQVSPFVNPFRQNAVTLGYNHSLVQDIPPPPPPPPMEPAKTNVATFPAYAGAFDTEKVINKVSTPTSSTPNVKVKLIHPEDDIPLEQIRLRSKRYSFVNNVNTNDLSKSSDQNIQNQQHNSFSNIQLPIRPWQPAPVRYPYGGHY